MSKSCQWSGQAAWAQSLCRSGACPPPQKFLSFKQVASGAVLESTDEGLTGINCAVY